jgi:DNA-binding NtrC family response regulator|tara:strand:- start:2468 stop:2866 length:399 start_codon:yes stop_codon:yes gene_type:complete
LIIARSKTISAKILIVDDEEMILELMAETITDTGYECFVANNVDAAVEVVKTTPGIVLIVTDLKMPGKTGADLIKIVEAECEQEIKFIVMSGHGSPRIEENGVDIASYPFLRKPLGIESLIEKISSVLEAKE